MSTQLTLDLPSLAGDREPAEQPWRPAFFFLGEHGERVWYRNCPQAEPGAGPAHRVLWWSLNWWRMEDRSQ